MLFLGRTTPLAQCDEKGVFGLTLLLIDNLGDGRKEGYRVRWCGEQARAWWAAHRELLRPGAALQVRLSHLHVYPGSNAPYTAELRARVVSMELVKAATEQGFRAHTGASA